MLIRVIYGKNQEYIGGIDFIFKFIEEDFEKQRAVKAWEFILDQIVMCNSPKDIPTLEELREHVMNSGLFFDSI
jgi:hypothetical protein